ncbi:RTA1 domain protein [Sporothrix brasiliensis 5110]|uniref:RTA1 domain protein n=1 Tax=Sporothrix brasiliensis 5110 TaxID=1398154 RepID=A0A0C2FCH1_9PEZI|nr:RTA1 domain protein [Sporothrix brasiliensis 5110]KIH88818.1 RTA1 domain protein [Sporothrix brasiliensis 5110]
MASTVNVTAHPFKNCKEVSPSCPVQATTLGYYPNVGINAFFAAGYGIATAALLITLIFGLLPRRTWSYSCFIAAGAALELAGYASRVPLHANPWDQSAFETQICAIILAPTLICIGIYLTLQHVCLALCPALSRIRPTLYPWVFVPLDVSCLLIQAAGGAIAASAGYTNTKLLNAGNRLIIAGIVLQVVVLAFFGLASLDYFIRVKAWIAGRDRRGRQPTEAALALWHHRRFRTFIIAVTIAYGCILIRCIYRIAEMAGGWGNKIMQDEPSFIVLEGFMIMIAVAILAGFQPGYFFPQMGNGRKQRRAAEAAALQANGGGEAGSEGEAAAAEAPAAATAHVNTDTETEKNEKINPAATDQDAAVEASR